jgi:hypothetical protein
MSSSELENWDIDDDEFITHIDDDDMPELDMFDAPNLQPQYSTFNEQKYNINDDLYAFIGNDLNHEYSGEWGVFPDNSINSIAPDIRQLPNIRRIAKKVLDIPTMNLQDLIILEKFTSQYIYHMYEIDEVYDTQLFLGNHINILAERLYNIWDFVAEDYQQQKFDAIKLVLIGLLSNMATAFVKKREDNDLYSRTSLNIKKLIN